MSLNLPWNDPPLPFIATLDLLTADARRDRWSRPQAQKWKDFFIYLFFSLWMEVGVKLLQKFPRFFLLSDHGS